MKRVIVAVYDNASQMFGQPFFVTAIGQALRSFTDEVNRPAQDNQLYQHPEDFSLYHIGYFEEETAVFTPPDEGVGPRRLVRGQEVQQKNQG